VKKNVGIKRDGKASNLQAQEHFTKVPKDKSPSDLLFIVTCLKKHFVFNGLTDSEM
jgi:hypothetical protein